MNESAIQVTIAGRTYPLTVAEGEAVRVREAAGKIDELVQRFHRDYGVSDRQDLIAMAALQLLSDTPAAPKDKDNAHIPAEVFDGLEEIHSLLAQAGLTQEDAGEDNP